VTHIHTSVTKIYIGGMEITIHSAHPLYVNLNTLLLELIEHSLQTFPSLRRTYHIHRKENNTADGEESGNGETQNT